MSNTQEVRITTHWLPLSLPLENVIFRNMDLSLEDVALWEKEQQHSFTSGTWHFKENFHMAPWASFMRGSQIQQGIAHISHSKRKLSGVSSSPGHCSCRLFARRMVAKALLDLEGLYHELGTNREAGGSSSSPQPSGCMVKSAVGEEDAVVSAWFVGAQQGEAVQTGLGVAVSLWLA